MADILGTVAATAQLAEMVIKLKKLYAEIKQTPNEVLELVEEVEVLLDLVSDMDQVCANNTFSSLLTPSWKKCNQLLKSSLDTLTQLVKDLQSVLTAHKRSGSIRAYFKKDDSHRYRERLERAKSTMALAQQLYSFAVFSDQQSQLLQKVQSIATCDNSSFQKQTTAVSTRLAASDQSSQQVYKPDAIAKSVQRSSIPSSKQKTSHTYYRLGLPTWMLRTGLEIWCQRSSYSLTVQFRIYNTVSRDSEVFKSAEEGDWRHVEMLFQQGRASPFDVDIDNATLLHIAAGISQPEACRMLLNHGVDPSHQKTTGSTAIERIVSSARSSWSTLGDSDNRFLVRDSAEDDRHDSTLMVLLNALQEPIDILSCGESYWHRDFWSLESVSCLLRASYPEHNTMSPEDRASTAMLIRGRDPRIVSKILGPDLSLQQAFMLLMRKKSRENHMLLLDGALIDWAVLLQQGDKQSLRYSKEWKDILREIIKFEAANTTLSFFWSPYFKFIEIYLGNCTYQRPPRAQNCSQFLTSIGRLWLELISDMGGDLTRYGLAEKTAFGRSRHRTLDMRSESDYWFRIIGLSVGPQIDDWKVFAVPASNPWLDECSGPSEYEMAGQFWNWVENPELFGVPGSFPVEKDKNRTTRWGSRGWVQGPVF